MRWGLTEIVDLLLSYSSHLVIDGEFDDAWSVLLSTETEYPGHKSAQTLRLLDNLTCIDADLHCRKMEFYEMGFLGRTMPPEAFADFILRNQVAHIADWRLEERFKILSDVGWHFRLFQQHVRGTTTDAEIVAYVSSIGLNALHLASGNQVLCYDSSSESIHARTEFLAYLLKIGTDPHALDHQQRTPFQVLLGIEASGRSHWITYLLENELQDKLKTWADAIRKAGLSLPDWVNKENAVWNSCVREDEDDSSNSEHLTYFMPCSVLCTPSSNLLGVEALRKMNVDIYERRHPPGTFPVKHPSIPTICWYPSQEPDVELWAWQRSVTLGSKPVAIYQSTCLDSPRSLDEMGEQTALYRAAQDDNGHVCRMLRGRPEPFVSG